MDAANYFFNIAQWGHDLTLLLLILMSILSLAFIFERYVFLKKIERQEQTAQAHLQDIFLMGDLTKLETLTYDKTSIMGSSVDRAFNYMEKNGAHGIGDFFSSLIQGTKKSLEKRLSFLATVGSNAPFIGLLGTVFGIMDAFRELAQSQGDASGVMLGISKALLATAVGLLVAIPAVVAYNVFRKKASQVLETLGSLKNLCTAYAETGKYKKGS